MHTPTCTQCGKCCQKGGPLLHKEDMPLLTQGHIQHAHFLTLRRGELAFDPIYNRLTPLEHEALKICGTEEKAHPWHCIFHQGKNCALHPLRPAQCQALFCTDPDALAQMYHLDRACRADIPTFTQDMLALAEAHEEECALIPLADTAYDIFQSDKPISTNQEQEILHKVRYDLAFRQLCTSKGNISMESLPCLLGRPVHTFLPSVGLELLQNKGELSLKKLAKAPYFS